jgi:hypothetical protein
MKRLFLLDAQLAPFEDVGVVLFAGEKTFEETLPNVPGLEMCDISGRDELWKWLNDGGRIRGEKERKGVPLDTGLKVQHACGSHLHTSLYTLCTVDGKAPLDQLSM